MKPGNEKIAVNNMLCITETEKAYGVIPANIIPTLVDPATVLHLDHVKTRLGDAIQWLPKSQVSNPVLSPCEIFPNLTIQFTCRFNPAITPYKTAVSLEIPKWLAEKKGFTIESGGAPVNNETPSADEDPNAGW